MALCTVTWAHAATTATIAVKASVEPYVGLVVAISQVTGGVWTLLPSNQLMDFGTLSYNSQNQVFMANSYFAVDVGVVNNTGPWTLQHTPSTIYNTTTGNTAQKLDDHINVSFMKQIDDTNSSTIAKVSFTNSNQSVSSTTLGTGWLRIYYGIGTGSGDNSGVTPVPKTQTAGIYQGSATITLTP